MRSSASPDSAHIEAELVRLCESDALRRAPTTLRLLRYLVDKCVDGDEGALCERAIALEVFRRDPAAYDPQNDPIVRVTVGRLRERLDTHYAHAASPPQLRIVLPRGRYAPEFVVVDPANGARRGFAVLRARNATADSELDDLCRTLTVRLTEALTGAGTPGIRPREAVARAESRSTDIARIAAQLEVEWLLETWVGAEADGLLRVTTRLLDAADGGVRWVETRAHRSEDRNAMLDTMVRRVLARMASPGQASARARRNGQRNARPVG